MKDVPLSRGPNGVPKMRRVGLVAEAHIDNGQFDPGNGRVICLIRTTQGQKSVRLRVIDDSSKYAPAPVLTEWVRSLPPTVTEITVKDPASDETYRFKGPQALLDSGVESVCGGSSVSRFTPPVIPV